MQDPDNRQPQPLGSEPPLQPTPPLDPTPSPAPYVPGAPLPSWFSEQTTVGSQPPIVPNVPKPKKKGLMTAIIVILSLAVLSGAAVLGYNYWYQNPEKVVTDGIVNAIKAKSIGYLGSFVASGDTELKVELTGRSDMVSNDLKAKISFKFGEEDIVIEGGALFDDKGDSYVKVTNADKILNKYRDMYKGTAESNKILDSVISKINNRWVRVNQSDLSSFGMFMGGDTKGQKCLSEAAAKIRDDESITSELADVYKKNRFITIDEKLKSQNGSLGYVLGVDETIVDAFTVDFKNTELYKSMVECDDSFKISDEKPSEQANADVNPPNTKTTLWVSNWSHEITKFTVKTDMLGDKDVFTFEPTFNKAIDPIKTPDNAITLKQLQSELEALYQAEMEATTDDDPSVLDEDAENEL
jgi:hypothetical protein